MDFFLRGGGFCIADLALAGRALHRAAMFFPLLIGISARLAALVPTFFLGLFGIFVFVAFSKKAFIISLLALLLSYMEKQKHSRPKIVHIHQIGHHHPEIGALEFEPHHTPHKFYEFPMKKPFRKWPKSDHSPWTLTGPSLDVNMDSYLPQPSRRSGQSVRQPLMYTPQGVYYPRYMWMNTTESPSNVNSSVGISPELQHFIEKTLVEEEDPR